VYGVDSSVEYIFACFGHVVQHGYGGWCTLTILALLPFIGLFILMVQVFSSMSIHFSFAASADPAAVSFKTWRNVADARDANNVFF
jgi:hypothetical protein